MNNQQALRLVRWLAIRLPQALAFGITIIALVVVAGVGALNIFSTLDLNQRIATGAEIFAGGTFVLAALAAVVALLAYNVSARRPNLILSATSGSSDQREFHLTMYLDNEGSATAFETTMQVFFYGALILSSAERWDAAKSNARWNADVPIHVGRNVRVRLPQLVVRATSETEEVRMSWYIVADRFRTSGSFTLRHP